MPAATAHKVSASNHKLYHEALRFTTIYVYLDVAYATLLLAAALHLSGVPVGLILGLDVPLKKSEAGGEGGLVRSGALSLATAGVMGLLVGVMVSLPPSTAAHSARSTAVLLPRVFPQPPLSPCRVNPNPNPWRRTFS